MATSCVPRSVADGRAGRARHRERVDLWSTAAFEAAYYQRPQATIEAA